MADDPCEAARAAYQAALQRLIDALDRFELGSSKQRSAEARWNRAEKARDENPGDPAKQSEYNAATNELIAAADADTRARRELKAAEAAAEAACKKVLTACDDPGTVTVNLGRAEGVQLTIACSIQYSRRLHASVSILGRLPPGETRPVGGVSIVDEDGEDDPTWGHEVGRWSGGDITIFYGPYLRRHLTENPLEQIVKHEVGHDVHNHLTDGEKAEWKRFWEAHKDEMPTGYARKDDDEGFAETYMYLRNRKNLTKEVRKAIEDILRQP